MIAPTQHPAPLSEPQPGYLTPILVDEREAARLLSLSPRKVAYLEQDGRLQAVWIDGSKRYPVDGIRDFAANLEGKK